jgi:hypothetical protein
MKLSLIVLLTIAIIGIYVPVNSQTLKGKVLNESGFAAANVKVHFTNKKNTFITNKDGSFKITATHLPDTLVFSADGFEPYKVVITEKNIADPDFSVVLLNKRSYDEEVASDEYRTKRKAIADKTYATGLAKSSAEKSATMKSESFTTALTGSVSGISLRGSSSISSSSMYAPKLISRSYSGSSKKLIFTDSVTKKDGKIYATRLLTAGEINDFTKWKMWDDFTDNEFKAYAKNWNIYMKQRYCVELQNTAKYAVVNHAVYLLNKYTNDTLWWAKTDNTGKAELWVNTNNENHATEYVIAIEGFNKINNPYTFNEGINRLTINTNCNTNNTVEIAFVVDATGSMGDEIEYLKLELEEVMHKTFTQYSNLEVKAGSVFYRDHGDDYVTKFVPLNSDLLKTLNFIKLQKAGGGGDMPEAVDDALETALDKLGWTNQARTKILFLILDAPPHTTASSRMNVLLKKAAEQGIRVVPIVCSGADKQTEFLMRSIALATNGSYLFLTNHSGVGDEHMKPTTDAFTVELLNNLMPRIIQQMIYVSSCNNQQQSEPPYKVQLNIVQIKATPNPTRGNVTITSTKGLKDIFITDFTGKILVRLNSNEKQLQWSINIQHYPSGTYLVRYLTNNNEWGVERIVLVH